MDVGSHLHCEALSLFGAIADLSALIWLFLFLLSTFFPLSPECRGWASGENIHVRMSRSGLLKFVCLLSYGLLCVDRSHDCPN